MPTYDSKDFNPPAPLARVGLKDPRTGESISDVRMLIDSGADITVLPTDPIDRLDWNLGEEAYELEGFDGRRSVARSVYLELNFLGRTFRGRFAVLESEIGILGRNVLNHFPLLLDGPNGFWREVVGPFR